MTYGYVEASMKMPSLPGSWPAFWMLENGWPPELDINEYPIFVNGTFTPTTTATTSTTPIPAARRRRSATASITRVKAL